MNTNPYSPPGAPPPNPYEVAPAIYDGSAPPMEPGGFGIRAVARIVDDVALMILSAICGAVGAIMVAFLAGAGLVRAGWEERMGHIGAGGFVVSLVTHLLYFSFAQGLGGTTVGKAICGLRVVTVEGNPCTFLKALGRSAAFYIDGLFFGLVGWSAMSQSPMRQRYGDRWAGTVCVRARSIVGKNTGNAPLGIGLGLLVIAIADVVTTIVGAL